MLFARVNVCAWTIVFVLMCGSHVKRMLTCIREQGGCTKLCFIIYRLCYVDMTICDDNH